MIDNISQKFLGGVACEPLIFIYVCHSVTLEVNLREHITCMPLPSVNKAAHLGFETQKRHHQKSKTDESVGSQKALMSSKIFFKKIAWSTQGIHCGFIKYSWYCSWLYLEFIILCMGLLHHLGSYIIGQQLSCSAVLVLWPLLESYVVSLELH